MASLTSILREEHSTITALLALMQQERQFLIGADIDSLSTTTAAKTALVNQMATLAQQRNLTLAQAGFPAREAAMDDYLAKHPDAEASTLWKDVLALGRDAKECNRVNGMLINKQLAHSNGALNALRAPSQGSNNFYGPTGQTTLAQPSRGFVTG